MNKSPLSLIISYLSLSLQLYKVYVQFSYYFTEISYFTETVFEVHHQHLSNQIQRSFIITHHIVPTGITCHYFLKKISQYSCSKHVQLFQLLLLSLTVKVTFNFYCLLNVTFSHLCVFIFSTFISILFPLKGTPAITNTS